MKIYTRTGDTGETGLFAGPRVSKDALRIEAYGAADELNAAIGLARTAAPSPKMDAVLQRIQHELFALGAELATPDPLAHGTRTLGPAHVAALEADIDRYESRLPPLHNFILPGGSRLAAQLHVARTVARRAERRLVSLVRHGGEEISTILVAYLNRLSDLLFVLARAANAESGTADVVWQKPS